MTSTTRPKTYQTAGFSTDGPGVDFSVTAEPNREDSISVTLYAGGCTGSFSIRLAGADWERIADAVAKVRAEEATKGVAHSTQV